MNVSWRGGTRGHQRKTRTIFRELHLAGDLRRETRPGRGLACLDVVEGQLAFPRDIPQQCELRSLFVDDRCGCLGIITRRDYFDVAGAAVRIQADPRECREVTALVRGEINRATIGREPRA